MQFKLFKALLTYDGESVFNHSQADVHARNCEKCQASLSPCLLNSSVIVTVSINQYNTVFHQMVIYLYVALES